ncbi:hypothetical protein D3C85_1116230 [compost metagenome]
MVISPTAQRGLGHVQVDHLFGTASDGGHGEPAGVGEQVQHTLALGVGLHPAAAVAHVQEQAGVLFFAQVQLEAQAAFRDQAFVHFLAQQPLGGAFQQVAVLQQQAVCAALLPGRRLAQGQEHILEHRKLVGLRLTKQRHQQHALQPIDGDLFQVWPAAAAAMEQAPGFCGGGAQGVVEIKLQCGEGVGGHGAVRGFVRGHFKRYGRQVVVQ